MRRSIAAIATGATAIALPLSLGTTIGSAAPNGASGELLLSPNHAAPGSTVGVTETLNQATAQNPDGTYKLNFDSNIFEYVNGSAKGASCDATAPYDVVCDVKTSHTSKSIHFYLKVKDNALKSGAANPTVLHATYSAKGGSSTSDDVSGVKVNKSFTVAEAPAPAASITSTAKPSAVQVGDQITVSGTYKNTGNTTFSGSVVIAPLHNVRSLKHDSRSKSVTIKNLAPGQSHDYSVTFTTDSPTTGSRPADRNVQFLTVVRDTTDGLSGSHRNIASDYTNTVTVQAAPADDSGSVFDYEPLFQWLNQYFSSFGWFA
jgi:hypothetical protein